MTSSTYPQPIGAQNSGFDQSQRSELFIHVNPIVKRHAMKTRIHLSKLLIGFLFLLPIISCDEDSVLSSANKKMIGSYSDVLDDGYDEYPATVSISSGSTNRDINISISSEYYYISAIKGDVSDRSITIGPQNRSGFQMSGSGALSESKQLAIVMTVRDYDGFTDKITIVANKQ